MYSIINDNPDLDKNLQDISNEAKDLIKLMLNKDPISRPSA